MKKIFILNAGLSNKGNLALWTTTIETIKNYIPDAEFNLTGPAEFNYNDFKVKKHLVVGPSIQKPQYIIITLLNLIEICFINICRKLNIQKSMSKNSRLFDYIDCDIVINSGGDHLSGESGIRTLGSFMSLIYAILLNKPVVLYGDSLGNFKNIVLNFFAKSVFNNTKLILLREKISKKYLNNNGITSPKIYVTADPAFLLVPAPQSRVLEIFLEEGINTNQKPLIGVNPSGLISRFAKSKNKKADENITDIFSKIIDKLIENLNATVIMVPHVYTTNVDDRIAIDRIFQKAKNKHKIKMIRKEYTPQELKGIIGQCDLFIGTRMHATIAATSMLVPTIGIAYSHKMHGIIGEMLGQEKYILNINELNNEVLISKVNDAWENREDIKKELAKRIPIAKKKAMLNGKLVKELLDSLN